jgi:cobalt-zinc-cadmium efflux system membrane fusion protein
VIEKKVTLGELATPSEPMFTVADLSRVWIQAALPEAALAKVRVGAKCEGHRARLSRRNLHAARLATSAPCSTRTRARRRAHRSANADGRLKPEMFATATIEAVGEKREAIALPDAAIVLLEGKPTSSSSSRARTRHAWSSRASASVAARC